MYFNIEDTLAYDMFLAGKLVFYLDKDKDTIYPCLSINDLLDDNKLYYAPYETFCGYFNVSILMNKKYYYLDGFLPLYEAGELLLVKNLDSNHRMVQKPYEYRQDIFYSYVCRERIRR